MEDDWISLPQAVNCYFTTYEDLVRLIRNGDLEAVIKVIDGKNNVFLRASQLAKLGVVSKVDDSYLKKEKTSRIKEGFFVGLGSGIAVLAIDKLLSEIQQQIGDRGNSEDETWAIILQKIQRFMVEARGRAKFIAIENFGRGTEERSSELGSEGEEISERISDIYLDDRSKRLEIFGDERKLELLVRTCKGQKFNVNDCIAFRFGDALDRFMSYEQSLGTDKLLDLNRADTDGFCKIAVLIPLEYVSRVEGLARERSRTNRIGEFYSYMLNHCLHSMGMRLLGHDGFERGLAEIS